MPVIAVGRELIDLDSMDLDRVSIEDIAHSLSNLCRWTGHTLTLYSVAEHSVRVCRRLRDIGSIYERQGLLHDAHEAIVGDVSSPLKGVLGAPWEALESRAKAAVERRFHVYGYPEDVQTADLILLSTEHRDLMRGDGSWLRHPPLRERIVPWSPDKAKREFLDECTRLGIA